jgi:Ca2+-binding RTX toxin-like protein
MSRSALIAAVAAVGLMGASAAEATALPRSTTDRPDDVAGHQIHVFYVVPSDRADRSLDTNGTLANTVASFREWLSTKAEGRTLRLDTFGGEPDITFRRLTRTDAELRAFAHPRGAIEADLDAAGFDDPDKIYAVYYDGTSDSACGGGAWPPVLPGNVAAMYLNGLPDYVVPCSSNPFAGPGGPPRYMEFAMLHEILHTLGFVASCAPHHHRAGHVSEDPDDLMWAGDGFWVPSGWTAVKLDAGNDDYYRHSIAGCLDFDDSPFLVPSAQCSRTGGTLTITGSGDAVAVSRTTAGVILANGLPCAGATTTNVDTIAVNGGALDDALTIDMTNGAFAPGLTAERAANASEIEFTVNGGGGTDSLRILGGSGVDTLRFGSAGAATNSDGDTDVKLAATETRQLAGAGGNDVLSAAAHASVGSALTSAVRIEGGSGDDAMTGGSVGDSLVGGDGADTLAGAGGNDVETGGNQNDTFVQGVATNGSDDLRGDAGTDLADYGQRTAAVQITLNGTAMRDDGATGATPERDVVLTENVTTGSAADTVAGDGLNNALSTGARVDRVTGGAGNDTITGGAGDETLDGGAGNDTFLMGTAPGGQDDLVGGTGVDTVDYGQRPAGVAVRVILGNALGTGDDGATRAPEGDDALVENATGGAGNDTLTGDRLANTLLGNAGADTLTGNAGADTLDGGPGTDTCDGGAGANRLRNCP